MIYCCILYIILQEATLSLLIPHIEKSAFVHVEITITSTHHDGTFHRNNPDKTFYPWDAFGYNINTWRDGCRHFQPCPVQSTPNLTGITHGSNCFIHGHNSEDNPTGGTYGSTTDPDHINI